LIWQNGRVWWKIVTFTEIIRDSHGGKPAAVCVSLTRFDNCGSMTLRTTAASYGFHMIWVALLLILVFIVAFAATVILLYMPFRRSPQRRWRDAVLRAQRNAQDLVSAETRELNRLARRREAERQSLTQEAFARLLSSISVMELEQYPGIGPATVGRLQQGGYRNLATFQNAHIRVSGLGQKRLADVTSAVRHLTLQAESRFQAGACQQSHDLEARLQELAAKYAELDCRAQARASGATRVIHQFEEPAALARQVTFWKHLWKESPIVPAELLHRGLPDLHTAVKTAEQQALEAFGAQKVTGTAVPQQESRPASPVIKAPHVRDAVPIARPASAPVGAPAPSSVAAIPTIQTADDAPAVAQPLPVRAALPSSQAQPLDQTSRSLLETTIEFAYAVARIDGSIAKKEKALIDEQFQRRYANDPAKCNQVKAYCAHYETAAIDLPSCLRRIKERVPLVQREQLMKFARIIAEASGPMNQREARLLERIAREWDVPCQPPAAPTLAVPEHAPQRKAQEQTNSKANVPDPRIILEIEPSAPLTPDLIRRHFNLLTSRVDPEKAQAMGREFVVLAQNKRQTIRAAAEALMKPFGEPLDLPDPPAASADLRHNPDLDAMFGA
jgi:uncharacterized tellurite resistance protein B-like protein